MSFLLGLTGSIGMGKSTTARMFAEHGVDVWDADAAVHDLYGAGQAGAIAIAAYWPEAVDENGVNRSTLSQILSADQSAFSNLEKLIHPLVGAHRSAFIGASQADICLFDIPLLFETGADEWLDAVCVVSVDAKLQRARVLAREGMTVERFEMILSRQMPDVEKRARADWIIETKTLADAERRVTQIVARIREEQTDA